MLDKLIPEIREIEDDSFKTGVTVKIDTSELIGLVDVEKITDEQLYDIQSRVGIY